MTKYHIFKVVQNSHNEKIDIKFPVTQQKIVGYKISIDLKNSMANFGQISGDGFLKITDNDYAKCTLKNRDGDVIIDDVLNENIFIAREFNEMDVNLKDNLNFTFISTLCIGADVGFTVKITFKTI